MTSGPAIAILFAVVVIVILGMMSGPDCPGGSVTASGIARCR